MKMILVCVLLFSIALDAISQDSLKVKDIDDYVQSVTNLELKQLIDSATIESAPGVPNKKTYVELYYSDSLSLQKVYTKTVLFPNPQFGMKDTMIMQSTVYYKNNQMVLTEETMTMGGTVSPVLRSYFDGKLIYSSIPLNTDKPDRSPILQGLAASYLELFLKLRLK